QMQSIIKAGLIDDSNVIPFAENKLTIIVPTGNPANIQHVEDIGKVGVNLILAVEDVPVREYADQVIGSLPEGTQKSIYENVVSEEPNVRQVVTK
ncbi:MAG: solute-binding protein, partial [Aliifodinibius sp.]|nr:solute-binding protein [Fodinibius sp.]NIV10579.1 solute-binding protein [Fodinibius sp.]NIY24207.1 solute-binding protein [Fodinibius sp.]